MQTSSALAIDVRTASAQVASALDADGDEDELVARLRYLGAQGDLAAAELGYTDAVVGLLGHSSPEVVAAAAEALGSMGAAAAKHVDAVAGTLDSQSMKVRQAAAYAVGQFGEAGRKHGDRLVMLIQEAGQGDEGEAAKVIALQALGQVGASSGAEVASALLNDASPQVQAAACLALGGLGEASAAGAVAAKLATEGTRCAAIHALADLGPQASQPYISDIIAKGICDKDMHTRGEAVDALARLAGASAEASKAAVPELSKLLKSEEPAVRAAATLCLGSVGRQ